MTHRSHLGSRYRRVLTALALVAAVVVAAPAPRATAASDVVLIYGGTGTVLQLASTVVQTGAIAITEPAPGVFRIDLGADTFSPTSTVTATGLAYSMPGDPGASNVATVTTGAAFDISRIEAAVPGHDVTVGPVADTTGGLGGLVLEAGSISIAGDVDLSGVSGPFELSSRTSIESAGGALHADRLWLGAATGIGAGTPLPTSTRLLGFANTSGAVSIANDPALTIDLIGSHGGSANPGGPVTLTSVGHLTVNGSVTARDRVQLRAVGGLVVVPGGASVVSDLGDVDVTGDLGIVVGDRPDTVCGPECVIPGDGVIRGLERLTLTAGVPGGSSVVVIEGRLFAYFVDVVTAGLRSRIVLDDSDGPAVYQGLRIVANTPDDTLVWIGEGSPGTYTGVERLEISCPAACSWLVSATSPLGGSPVPAGPERRLNTITDGNQFGVDLGAAANGSVLAAWADGSYPNPLVPDQRKTGIRGAELDAGGNVVRTLDLMPVGPTPQAFPVNGYGDARIASTRDGFFQTALHTSELQPFPTVEMVRAATVGNQIVLPTSPEFGMGQGDVVELPIGGAAVVTSGGYVAGSIDVAVDVIGDDGAVLVDNAIVNQISGTAGYQSGAAAGAWADGLVVAFRDAPDNSPQVGDVVLARTTFTGVPTDFRRIPLAADQGDIDVAVLPAGDAVVVFTDRNPGLDGAGTSIRARYVSVSGVQGPVATINEAGEGDQTNPAITALADGRLFVTWTDGGGHEVPGGSGSSVRGRVLALDNGVLVRDGVEFQVNTEVAGDQTDPDVATLADGRVLVAWTTASGSLDPSGTGISMRTFDPRTTPTHPIGRSRRACMSVSGAAGDLAVVNLTPVNAGGPGHGQLVSSDVMSPPVASNVNFTRGSFDPNVAITPIGADGRVCYVNSEHTTIDLVADQLGSIASAAFTAPPGGAPLRVADTRTGFGGGHLAPAARSCFAVAGAPGAVVAVNLTPVNAAGLGNGQLISSDVAAPPVASNVNFGPGSFDPNVAFAPIGADGKVCFVNSMHTSIDLVADQLGAFSAGSFAAPAGGASVRVADTRIGLAGARIEPLGRRCFVVPGTPGDVAVVNLTPVNAAGLGNGLLEASDVIISPGVSNVNFAPGSFDPNVAFARIGGDGRVCFVNSEHTSLDLVADLLGTVSAAAYSPASNTVPVGAVRVLDTRHLA